MVSREREESGDLTNWYPFRSIEEGLMEGPRYSKRRGEESPSIPPIFTLLSCARSLWHGHYQSIRGPILLESGQPKKRRRCLLSISVHATTVVWVWVDKHASLGCTISEEGDKEDRPRIFQCKQELVGASTISHAIVLECTTLQYVPTGT